MGFRVTYLYSSLSVSPLFSYSWVARAATSSLSAFPSVSVPRCLLFLIMALISRSYLRSFCHLTTFCLLSAPAFNTSSLSLFPFGPLSVSLSFLYLTSLFPFSLLLPSFFLVSPSCPFFFLPLSTCLLNFLFLSPYCRLPASFVNAISFLSCLLTVFHFCFHLSHSPQIPVLRACMCTRLYLPSSLLFFRFF